MPHLQPPSTTVYEDDRDALNAQFDAAEALLKEIQSETSAIRAAVDEQKERLDKAADDVQAVVKEMREGEVKTRDSMREMREEVDNIRDMIPKVMIRPFTP
jgi:peroxin-14